MFGIICNIVLIALILYPFVKTRKTGFSKIMLSPPWSIFSSSFMRMLDIESQIAARDSLSKGNSEMISTSKLVTIVVWTVTLSKVLVTYIASKFCNEWLVLLYIVSTLVRMPVFYACYLHFKKYIDNPRLIKRIA